MAGLSKIGRLLMNSKWLLNSHQRHKFLRARHLGTYSNFRVLEMAFPGCFPLWTPCCFVRIHARLRTVPWTCPRHSKTSHWVKFTHFKKRICIQRHSKLGNEWLTILFNGAYFLLAAMVEGDESSQQRWLTSWRFWPAAGPY